VDISPPDVGMMGRAEPRDEQTVMGSKVEAFDQA
jgi:hypothetical protein